MKLRTALAQTREGVRKNLLPALLLQGLMAIYLVLYYTHDGTRHFLEHVAKLKQESGYFFAFITYALASGMLPEILRVIFFQKGQVRKINLFNILTGMPGWGASGMLVDFLYRCQGVWFGTGHEWQTILLKMLVDQFIFSPFISAPLLAFYFGWRDRYFRWSALKEICEPTSFVLDRVLPVQVAGWCVWIPGVCLVYLMPSTLQIPVAATIQIFWALLFTFVNAKKAEIPSNA